MAIRGYFGSYLQTTQARDFNFFPATVQNPCLVTVALTQKQFYAQYYDWFCHGHK